MGRVKPGGETASEPTPADESAAAPPAPPNFSEQFDARAVRPQKEQFAPHAAILEEWLRSAVLPLEKLGLAPPLDQPTMTPVEEPEGHIRVSWKWPAPRFSEECVLAVCAAEPKAGEDAEQLAVHWREAVTAAQWTANGSNRLIPVEKGWEGSSVAVWAVVDLGFAKLYSPPLILGQIESRSRWKWPRLFARRGEPEETT